MAALSSIWSAPARFRRLLQKYSPQTKWAEQSDAPPPSCSVWSWLDFIYSASVLEAASVDATLELGLWCLDAWKRETLGVAERDIKAQIDGGA